MIVDRMRFTVPLGAGIFEGADQFFFLGVHTEDRQTLVGKTLALLANIQELRITVGAFAACDLLAVNPTSALFWA